MTLKILPRHNGVVPIKITGQAINERMAYFITVEDSTQGRVPNINIINSFHNYTNKHIIFNKGEYVGYLEPAIEDHMDSDLPSHAQPDTHSTNSVTTQGMMAE